MAGFFNLTKEKLINKVVEIAINEILPNPYQPRTDFNEDISALAESIAQNGILQPLSVRRKDGRFEGLPT